MSTEDSDRLINVGELVNQILESASREALRRQHHAIVPLVPAALSQRLQKPSFSMIKILLNSQIGRS